VPFAQLLGDNFLPTVSAHAILAGQPGDKQQDTATDTASRTDQPAAVLCSVTGDTPTRNAPQQNLLGRGCTTSVWCTSVGGFHTPRRRSDAS